MDCLPGKQLLVKAPGLVLTACQPKLLFGSLGGDDDDDDKELFNDDSSSAFFGGCLTADSTTSGTASSSSGSGSSSDGSTSSSSSSSSSTSSPSRGSGGGAMWVPRGQRYGRRRPLNGFPPGPSWSQALWGGAGDGSYRSSGGGGGGSGTISGSGSGGGSSLLFPFGGVTGAGLDCPSFGSLDQLDPQDATAMVRLAVPPATVLASLGTAAAAAATDVRTTPSAVAAVAAAAAAAGAESGTREKSRAMLAAIEVEDMSLPLKQLQGREVDDHRSSSNSDTSFAAALADALLPLKQQLAIEAISRRRLCAAVQVLC